MKKLTIDRNEWGRVKQREPFQMGSLYDPYKKTLCCMGFHCEQNHGKTREEMAGVAMPTTIHVDDLRKVEHRLARDNDRSRADRSDASIDWSNVTDEQQEQLIAAGFALVGVEVEFVN